MSKWIAWHGLEDKSPVFGPVNVLFRDGVECTTKHAEDLRWFHKNASRDIVSYQLTSAADESIEVEQPTEDAVNNPKHYTSHPSGIECIDVTRHMSFNLGNATKYIWRCDLKKDAIEDLRKAIFYLNDEINLRLSKKEC